MLCGVKLMARSYVRPSLMEGQEWSSTVCYILKYGLTFFCLPPFPVTPVQRCAAMRPAAMSQYPSRIISRIGRVRVVYFLLRAEDSLPGTRFINSPYASRQTDPLGNANSLGHWASRSANVLPRLSPGIGWRWKYGEALCHVWLAVYFDVMTDFSSFSINNVECALITSGWFRRIYPLYCCMSIPAGWQCLSVFRWSSHYRRIASAYFSLLCLDIRFPLRGLYHTLSVCQLRFMFVQVLSECLGMGPNSLAAWAIRRGVFSQAPDGFSRIWRLWFFIPLFRFPQIKTPSALPESPARSLTKSIFVQIRTKSFRRDVFLSAISLAWEPCPYKETRSCAFISVRERVCRSFRCRIVRLSSLVWPVLPERFFLFCSSIFCDRTSDAV